MFLPFPSSRSLQTPPPSTAPFLNFEFVRQKVWWHISGLSIKHKLKTEKKKGADFHPLLTFIFLLNEKKKSLLKTKLKISISMDKKKHYSTIYTTQADLKKLKSGSVSRHPDTISWQHVHKQNSLCIPDFKHVSCIYTWETNSTKT